MCCYQTTSSVKTVSPPVGDLDRIYGLQTASNTSLPGGVRPEHPNPTLCSNSHSPACIQAQHRRRRCGAGPQHTQTQHPSTRAPGARDLGIELQAIQAGGSSKIPSRTQRRGEQVVYGGRQLA